jgi:uncharacterized protein (TIRG00374 family)
LKKLLLTLVKVGLSLAIVAYLVINAQRNRVFSELAQRPKDWSLLAAATVSCFVAVMLTMIRWYYLVRVLGMRLGFRELLRIGFVGYLFNMAPTGIVGGDLLKTMMLARHERGHRADAFASVVMDRLIGLYMLFVISSVAILLVGFLQQPDIVLSRASLRFIVPIHLVISVHLICWCTLGTTVLGTLAFAALFVPAVTNGSWVRWLERQPWVGQLLARLIGSIGFYRHHRGVLALSVLLTLGVHSLYTLGIYLITRGLYDPYPPLSLQFVHAPLAATMGTIPLPLGPYEAVLDMLYAMVPLPGGVRMVAGQGLVVALSYRIASLVTAAVGMAYYFSARQEFAEALHEAEAETDGEDQSGKVPSGPLIQAVQSGS